MSQITHRQSSFGCKQTKSSLLLTIILVAVTQIIYSNIKFAYRRQQDTKLVNNDNYHDLRQLLKPIDLNAQTNQPMVPFEDESNQNQQIGFGLIYFAEAGKKKKKEKSEVVVISVQNSPAKGHGMYPVFIPSCGGGHGYGRRKR